MFTLFTIPKPFAGHSGTIQINAIKSWVSLCCKPEVILFGDEEGVAEIALEYNVINIDHIEKSEGGTPYLNDAFNKAVEVSNNNYLCYVNADIILMNDFVEVFNTLKRTFDKILALGRRWDVDIKENLEFSKGWDIELREYVRTNGKLHGYTGIDYLLFTKETFKDIPSFIVGRVGWDNWMVYNASSNNIPVVDVTKAATVVHQNHDYSHLSNGMKTRDKGNEAIHNIEQAGGYRNLYSIRDAKYELTGNGIRQRKDWVYKLYRWLISKSKLSPIVFTLVMFIRNMKEKYL